MTLIYVTHDQTEAMSMADLVVLMRDGRIEQAASPAEIYARPATTFAASFIGSPPMVMLPAELLPAASRPDRRADLVFGIRGEDIELRPQGEGRLAAVVVEQEFLGAETFIHLDVAGTHRLIAREPGASLLRPGEPVGLDWREQATHWFDEASGRRLALPSLPISASTPDRPPRAPALSLAAKGH